MADPVQYLHLVRDTLSHKDYLQFCKIMAEYKSNRICTQETVKEALRIFGNNLDLKKGFQIFFLAPFIHPFPVCSGIWETVPLGIPPKNVPPSMLIPPLFLFFQRSILDKL